MGSLEIEVDQVEVSGVASPLDHHYLPCDGEGHDVGVWVDDLRRWRSERLRFDRDAAFSTEAAQHPGMPKLSGGVARPEHAAILGIRHQAVVAAAHVYHRSSVRLRGRARAE